MWPGAMQLTRTLSRPWVTAMVVVRPTTPALDVAYGTAAPPLPARSPAIDDTLMMEPPPASIIRGMACLLVSIIDFRFTSSTRSHRSSSTSTTLPLPRIPTLLNRMFTPPYC